MLKISQIQQIIALLNIFRVVTWKPNLSSYISVQCSFEEAYMVSLENWLRIIMALWCFLLIGISSLLAHGTASDTDGENQQRSS